MTLQLEVGKFYKNRKGEKIGPLVENQPGTIFIFTLEGVNHNNENHKSWLPHGSVWSAQTNEDDLIEEWKDKEKSVVNEGDLPEYDMANGGIHRVDNGYDPVNNPSHYTSHPSGIECIEITRHMNFNLGNALKYIWRADLKDDAIQDLKKAIFYIQDEIDKRSEQK